MAMVSSIQEAQKDNVRSFNDYMLKVLEVVTRKSIIEYFKLLSPLFPALVSNVCFAVVVDRMIGKRKSVIFFRA